MRLGEGGVDRKSEDVAKCIMYLKFVIHRVIKIGTRLRNTGVKLSRILIMTQYSAWCSEIDKSLHQTCRNVVYNSILDLIQYCHISILHITQKAIRNSIIAVAIRVSK